MVDDLIEVPLVQNFGRNHTGVQNLRQVRVVPLQPVQLPHAIPDEAKVGRQEEQEETLLPYDGEDGAVHLQEHPVPVRVVHQGRVRIRLRLALEVSCAPQSLRTHEGARGAAGAAGMERRASGSTPAVI